MELNVEVPHHIHDEGKLHGMLQGNFASFPGNATVPQFFQTGFIDKRIDPNALALVDDEDEITYTFSDLDVTTSKLAEVMRDILEVFQNKNPDGDVIIGVCMPPSNQLVMTLIAIMKLGAAYLPLDVSFPEDMVLKIVKDCKPVMIICDSHSNVLEKFDIVKDTAKVVPTKKLFKLAEEKELSDEDVRNVFPLPGDVNMCDRTAIVLYTSGSSGEPKGVRLNHSCIMNRLNWQWTTFPYLEDEKCVFKTSLSFLDSVGEIFGPLLQGFNLTILSKKSTTNPSIFMEKLEHYGITRVVLVPSLLKAIFQTMQIIGVEEGRRMLDTVKLWVCSGEAIAKDMVMLFFDHFHSGFTLCNFYGSTELMADVTFVAYSSKHDMYSKSFPSQIPIGQPINNTIIYVLNKNMEMCQQDEFGEIHVAGHNLAKGYVGNPQHPNFVPNPFTQAPGFNRLYKTGDFGRITETQGKIRMLGYEGRIDSQIKIRGQRVDLSEVEVAISGISLITKSKVLCYHPGQPDQSIIAFIVPANGAHIDRIKTLMEQKLRDYERPILRVMTDIPLLVNGKVDRQQLLQIYEQGLANRKAFDWTTLDVVDSKLDVAKAVLTIVSEATGTSIQTIAENINNSFYNVGGSSLNSITVIVKLRDAGYQISIQDFTRAKSIKQIIYITEPVKDVNIEEIGDGGCNWSWNVSKDAEVVYSHDPLADKDEDETCHMIAQSFANHGDLEVYTKATYDEFNQLIRSIWSELVEKGFSFIIRRKEDDKAIGVSLSFDFNDKPTPVKAIKGITSDLKMLGVQSLKKWTCWKTFERETFGFLENGQQEKLSKGKGKILHSFMMGTSEAIHESENVLIIQYMEELVLKMATDRGFFGVIATNTSPLTQQIALSLHGYETLAEYQVNRYVAPDGTTPFILAPDSLKIICCWKRVGNHHWNEEKVISNDNSPRAISS